MSDLRVSHYLRIYQRRVRSAESRGTVDPKALNQMRTLLHGLQKTRSDAFIRLEQPPGKVLFVEAESGRIIGELEYLDREP